jgi:hypothetical protein
MADEEGAMAMAEEPMMDPPMEDKKEEKMEEKEKSHHTTESEDSADEEKPKDILEPCCCCLCVCHNERTKNLSCCMFFPIKAGIVLIGAIFLLLVGGYFTWHMFMLMNEHIDWYFPVIVLLLLAPMIVGASFWIYFYIKDKKSSRGKLTSSLTLGMISIATIAAWNVIYFIWFYKRDKEFVYQGLNDGPYKKTPKKTYIFSILFESCIILAFFSYAMCVTVKYDNAMDMSKPFNE